VTDPISPEALPDRRRPDVSPDELIARLTRRAAFDAADPALGSSYNLRALGLTLWRPVLPARDDDAGERYASTVAVRRPSYDQAVAGYTGADTPRGTLARRAAWGPAGQTFSRLTT